MNDSGQQRGRSRGIKLITVIGNLGADPEMRYTQSGTPFTSFRVAVNDYRRGQDGQDEENPDWFRVTCWGAQAESANKYLSRGSQVFVEGRFRASEWTGNDGQTRTSLEINATNMQFLARSGGNGLGEGSSGNGANVPNVQSEKPLGGEGSIDPDDLPF